MTTSLLAAYRRHSLGVAATRNVDRALRQAVASDRVQPVMPGAKPVGTRALRGVPVFPHTGGICGTMPGTDPLQAVLDRVCDCGRRKLPDDRYCGPCFDRLHPPKRKAS